MKQNTSQRIANEIKQRIRAGRIGPGEKVPSAREIVKEHGVALATASKVLAILRREGLVKAQRGVGMIVRTGERAHELTLEQVVHAGIAIADEEGLGALTLRQVAIELGVATVKLNRVVDSREDLLMAMADGVLGAVVLPRSTDWRSTLESLGRAQWATYERHPWLVETLSMTRPQLLPNGMRHTELALAAIETLGLGPAMTLRTGIMFLAYVRGMAVGLEAERQAEQDTGMSSDQWIDSRESLFAPFVERFPTLGKLTNQPGIDMSLQALFERGLAVLLDGLSSASSSLAR